MATTKTVPAKAPLSAAEKIATLDPWIPVTNAPVRILLGGPLPVWAVAFFAIVSLMFFWSWQGDTARANAKLEAVGEKPMFDFSESASTKAAGRNSYRSSSIAETRSGCDTHEISGKETFVKPSNGILALREGYKIDFGNNWVIISRVRNGMRQSEEEVGPGQQVNWSSADREGFYIRLKSKDKAPIAFCPLTQQN